MSILAHENIQRDLSSEAMKNLNIKKEDLNDFIHFFHKDVEKKFHHKKEKLGGKGLSVLEMSSLGIPVPEGFIISTDICIEYNKTQKLPENFEKIIHEAIKKLEKITQKSLDGKENLLMLSIRSGAPISMPGMMDTILNIGLTRENLKTIAKDCGDRFAYNSYLRLLECYISTVLNLDYKNLFFNGLYLPESFNKFLRSDYRYSATNQEFEDLIDFVSNFIEKNGFGEILRDVKKQIFHAIIAVLNSYNSSRAIAYRELNGIPDNLGTAVIVQAMVFGNMNDLSCTGVLFSRDPSTGENKIFGEYIINAQGEDVVSGICTPCLINDVEDEKAMINLFSQCYKELDEITEKLETHHKDMQDIEFTVENNKLYVLQSRSAKRSVDAEMKCAIDMVREGLISEKEALLMINPSSIDKMLHPVFRIDKNMKSITRGLPASPGAAVGKVIFDSEKACEHAKSEKVLLVRMDTSPEDIMGMMVSQGILTARGGMTSHAAVVARGMGKPCVCGAMKINVYENKGFCEILQSNGEKLIVKEGDVLSINGTTGDVYLGEIELKDSEFSENFNLIMSWADKYRRLKVRVNADTEQDCKIAKKFGAEGIGLCRTEHMFFDEKRILYVRQMILSEKNSDRKNAIHHIKSFQKEDFIKIFRMMNGLPVTIRLLDPPLHEFLPLTKETVEKFAQFSNFTIDYVNEKVLALNEKNPMLGHRGCRLGISHPEIYECQVEAIFEAIVYLEENESNIVIHPEIMIPIVGWSKEAKILTAKIHEIAFFYQKKHNIQINYLVGSMIELPRAALSADEIAKDVEFFSFGTNDLTQTTLGISRDDLIHFLNDYIENGIFDKSDDPFINVDPCVGELIKIACERGRKTRLNIKIGVCGEHGGSPKSIELFEKLGLDYVSTSPYRVPIARLAAAQAVIKKEG
jgi:pyruvate,orthophosphate dikinase